MLKILLIIFLLILQHLKSFIILKNVLALFHKNINNIMLFIHYIPINIMQINYYKLILYKMFFSE